MDSQRKTAEQVFISGVESSIARATQINQYDHLLITVLADLMQIQCIAAGNTDLLKFNLPSGYPCCGAAGCDGLNYPLEPLA